jgi:hypothetical protein
MFTGWDTTPDGIVRTPSTATFAKNYLAQLRSPLKITKLQLKKQTKKPDSSTVSAAFLLCL